MRAIILAGGRGTRLRPLTISFPKPLVPLGGMPILELVVRQLRAAGFERVTLSTGYLAELIRAYFGDGSRFGIAIDSVHEEKPLSTAGPLRLVKDLPEHFLVMNGDLLTDLDYAAFLREHVASGAAATVATKTREAVTDFGIVEADANGDLERWIEKPTHSYQVSMGVYALSRATAELIREDEAIGMPDLLLRAVAAGRRVACHRFDGYWLDIGRVDDYETAQQEFEQRRDRLVPRDA